MGFLSLLFLALDYLEYAPDSEPKLSLSLSLSSDLLPCSANMPNMLCCGVCAPVVCTAGLLLVLSGTFGGAGTPKDRRVGAHVCMVTGMKGILFRMSMWSSDVSATCCPLSMGGVSSTRCCAVLGRSSMVSSSSQGICGLAVGWRWSN